VLEAGVFTLGVLPNHNDIHILVASGKPREIEAIDERGVEVELLPELHVERVHSATDPRPEPALQAHLVLLDRLDHFLRDTAHIAVHVVALEVHRRVHCLHDLLHRVRHQRPHAVPGDQSHRAWRPVAGSGHVGHGSGPRGVPVRELLEDREGSARHVMDIRKIMVPPGVKLSFLDFRRLELRRRLKRSHERARD